MKVTGLKSSKIYNLRIADYIIDWRAEISKPQARVKQFLYPYWKTAICGEEVRIPGSRCRLDLVNFSRKVVIEVSPSGSHSFNKFFHKSKFKFAASVRRDLDKQEWCQKNGFLYIELTDDDLDNLSKKMFAERGLDL